MKTTTLKKIIITTSILIIILSAYTIYSQTNILNKQSNTEFTITKTTTNIREYADGGYNRIIRNPQTPSASDWATFENKEKYEYFSINPNEEIKTKIVINTPKIIAKGTYYIDIETVYLNQENKITTIDFIII